MKEEKLLSICRCVVVFIFVLLAIPINAYAALWNLEDVGLVDIEIDENNKITSYTIHFEIDRYLAQAEGFIGIQKVPFVEEYDDNEYGDFTDFGKVARERYDSLSAITDDAEFMSKYGIIDFSSDDGNGFPVFGNYKKIERTFADLDIQLYENGTYYVYLWTHYRGLIYPDALIGKIDFDGNGKISINDENGAERNVYYTLKYETNGGSKIESKSIKKDDKAIEPMNPIREGFGFDGWYADELLETSFDFDTKITDNTTIYAKWNENLSFKGYDGFYDGAAHSIIVDGDLEGYKILYSLDGKSYELNEAPKYTEVGNYTIYYKVTKEGFEDITGSVEINIKEKVDEDKKQDNTINENPKTNDGLFAAIVVTVLSLGTFVIASKKVLFK